MRDGKEARERVSGEEREGQEREGERREAGPRAGRAEVLASRPVGGTGRRCPGAGAGPGGPRPGGAGRAAAPYHHLVLRAPHIAATALPGQFVHVFCPARPVPGAGPGLPFLRRPLSLHDVDPDQGTVSLLFRVKGPGTVSLSLTLPGQEVDLIGPLGNGPFPVPEREAPVEGPGTQRPLLVGGGIGVAPLLFLARKLAGRGPVTVLVGVGGAGDLELVEPFRTLPGDVKLAVATEDGTPGTVHGLATALLERELAAAGSPGGVPTPVAGNPGGVQTPVAAWAPAIYACGPRPMLAEVWRLARRVGAGAWFSMEERMACGVGACRGCAVRVRSGPGDPPYRLVCRDGPVFDAAALDWGESGHGS